jgi:large subunit ribosomal protein L20
MVRVKRGNVRTKKRKKILNLAKGFYGSLHTLFRPAKQAVTQALTNSFRGRREKKRTFRGVWIARMNAACRENGLSYSKFMFLCKQKNITLNRKMLAEIAMFDEKGFREIVNTVNVQ